MTEPASDRYEYIRAVVDCGDLRWEYCLAGGAPQRMSHDEDVSGWGDEDIVRCTRSMLCVDDDDPVRVEVRHA